MNKSELAERLAGRTGMSKAAAMDAVDGVFGVIGEALANGEEARILGFGTFDILGALEGHRVAFMVVPSSDAVGPLEFPEIDHDRRHIEVCQP